MQTRIRRLKASTYRVALVGLLFALTFPSPAAFTNDLIADFPLFDDGKDALGRNPPFTLKNAPFVHGTIYLNGQYEHSGLPAGMKATATITNLHYDSLTVSLDFYPLPFKKPRTMNRVESVLDTVTRGYYGRWFGGGLGDCPTIIVGGSSYRWLGLNREANGLELTLDNQSFKHQFKGVKFAARRWHNLVCSLDLKQHQILTMLDGQLLETIHLPENFKLSIIGSPDEATDREFTFENYSNGDAALGYAANLKVFGHALSAPELATLWTESKSEQPTFNPPGQSFLPFVVLLVVLTAAAFVLVFFRWRNRAAHAQPTTQEPRPPPVTDRGYGEG